MKRGVALLLVVALAGCATAPLEVNAWIVRRASEAAPPNDPDAILVGLTAINVASYLDGMVVQRENGEIDTLVYHRWAAPVGEMVRVWTHSRLSESPRVRGVVGPGGRGKVRLRVEVRRFEFVEPGDGTAVATVELWGLVDSEPFGPILGTETVEATAAERLPVAMAGALARAVERVVPLIEVASTPSGQ